MDDRSARRSAKRLLDALGSLERERLAFSEADMAARVRVAEVMHQAHLRVAIDDAFNVVGWFDGKEQLPPLVIGSHLDTVPDPGRLDGALGVLAGVECVRELATSVRRLRHPVAVVGFSDEEGTATRGCWGARSVTHMLTDEEKRALTDPFAPLRRTLTAAAARLAELGWSIDPLAAPEIARLFPAAYLELHIEQGPELDRAGVPTAAVTSIVGIDRYEVTVRGVPGHAGTVPVADRDDAVVRAAELVSRFWEYVRSLGARAVANVGMINVRPGSFNVIPEEVWLGVEVRSPEDGVLDDMRAHLEELAGEQGGEVELAGHDAPIALGGDVRRAILESAAALGLPCLELPSWAGHDAAVFASLAPTGMIFVPSIDGASHCPREATAAADIASGIRLLSATLARLDELVDGKDTDVKSTERRARARGERT